MRALVLSLLLVSLWASTISNVPVYSPSICGAPVLTTTDTVIGGGTLSTGGYTPGIPDKRSLAPPCSVNGTGTYIRILNVTLYNIANGQASQDCNPINSVTYCDSTADALSPGNSHRLHVEIDQAWKASSIAPPDFPTNGSRIDLTGYAYWDSQPNELHWEMHPVESWALAAKPISDAGNRYKPCFTATETIPNSTATISTTKCLYITVVGACTLATADINIDGRVDILDIAIVAFHFGQNRTGPEPYNPLDTPTIAMPDVACAAFYFDHLDPLP